MSAPWLLVILGLRMVDTLKAEGSNAWNVHRKPPSQEAKRQCEDSADRTASFYGGSAASFSMLPGAHRADRVLLVTLDRCLCVCRGGLCRDAHVRARGSRRLTWSVSLSCATLFWDSLSNWQSSLRLDWLTGQRAPGGLQSLLPMLRSQACATVPAFSMAAAAAVHQAPHPISHLLCPRHIFNQENSSYKWAEPDFLPIFRLCQSWCETNKREEDGTTEKH